MTVTATSVIDESELEHLRDSATGFGRQFTSAARFRERRDHGSEFDGAAWRALADAGFLGVTAPEAYGGLALSLRHMTAIAERLGAFLMPEPVTASAFFAGEVIAAGDNAALKSMLLPAIVTGDLVPGVAWEESLDSPLTMRTDTVARQQGDAIVLDGRKRFVRPGLKFDGLIVSAAEDGDVGLYWVPQDMPGLAIEQSRLADGGHVADIILTDVTLSVEQRIQSPVRGAADLADAVARTALVVSAELLGIGQHVLTMTLDYLRVREQFGKPIGSFQALQHRAVDLYIQQQLARVALEAGLAAYDGDSETDERLMLASRAKARCSDAAMLITREAIQMHGAIGFTDEHDVGLYLKRALVLSAWLGNAAQHRRRYAAIAAHIEGGQA